LLAELTDVMSDGVAQDLWILSIGFNNNSCAHYLPLIQTELAFTLAKNATKPNPFEIILLQTTRKENNWKTKETLARGVVTLEKERIKGSNP